MGDTEDKDNDGTTRWYYDKKELKRNPSVASGMECELETRYRREGATFIQELIRRLSGSASACLDTMATAIVYFHRFFMQHKFQDFQRYPTACACVFLAGKVEETPKKCKDVIKYAFEILANEKESLAQFEGKSPTEEVMTIERVLLQTIKFEIQVEHPYSFVLQYAKCLQGDKARLDKMVQMAWNFVNDSLCTTLCIQWEPEIIAIALMYLAGKLHKFEVVNWVGRTKKHLRWWDAFVQHMSIDILEDICHQVLDHYSVTQAEAESKQKMSQPPGSHPMVSKSVYYGHSNTYQASPIYNGTNPSPGPSSSCALGHPPPPSVPYPYHPHAPPSLHSHHPPPPYQSSNHSYVPHPPPPSAPVLQPPPPNGAFPGRTSTASMSNTSNARSHSYHRSSR